MADTAFEREGVRMSLLTMIREFWRFLKDYRLKIILGSVVVALLAVAGRYYLAQTQVEETQEHYDYLANVYQQTPASLEMVATLEDGQLFTNSHIFDEYFSKPSVIQQVEDQTGIEFSQWYDSEQALELFKTGGFRGGLAAIRDSSSNVITLRFLVGQTSEENLAIAEAYADILREGDLPFLRNTEIAIITEPVSNELIPFEMYDNLASPETLNPFASPSAPSFIVYGVAGFIAGAFLTTAAIFVLRWNKSVITYGFDYAWSMEDYHLLYDRQNTQGKSSLEEFLRVPQIEHRVVLSQQPVESSLNTSLINPEQTGLVFLGGIQELAEVNIQPDELVVLVQTNQTDKNWYQEQMLLAKLYAVPVKIIHFI